MPRVSAKPTVYSYFGQRVSSDTAGPFPESSSGFKYAVCFYDHFTKYVAIYFLRTHYGNEVLMALKSFVLDHKRYQSVSAEWNERSFSMLGPISKSILQTTSLPKTMRTEAQKAVEGKAEWKKAGRQAQQQLDAIRGNFSPRPLLTARKDNPRRIRPPHPLTT